MPKIALIRCGRYDRCSGAGCFRSILEKTGQFTHYADEPIEIVGHSTCGGCPGVNIEYVPEAFKNAGAEVIHLTTCFLCGFPPCTHLRDFVRLIKERAGLPVVVGTHLFPKRYFEDHMKIGDWEECNVMDLAKPLFPSKQTG